ncbi:MAG: hypothetical protein GY869_26605, partial [Planctomycetes bacterium]|nr:hypothetical protein [Planctomycetota bacterium]
MDLVSSSYYDGIFVFKGLGDGKFGERMSITFEGGVEKTFTGSSGMFIDWDGDGDLDLCVAEIFGDTFVYPNVGTNKSPVYDSEGEAVKTRKDGKKISGFPLNVSDWDKDGLFDFIELSLSG